MKQKQYLKTLSFCLIWLLSATTLLAQIQITFPMNRIVFQRDNLGNGVIPITGQYTQAVDRIEARVVAVSAGQGTQTNWQTIQQNPQGGFFSGNIQVRGGWYQLEIRGIYNNNVIDTDEISRVGVGEVFLIAGQSNAQGLTDYGSSNASDDRVNCVNYNNSINSNSNLPPATFTQINNNSTISPRGQSSWFWGRLGDLLASRLNVPVLFYNSAFEGTAVRNWRESMDGGSARSIYVNSFYSPGQPYANLRLALNYYASTTGLRAVLWQQGEADNYAQTSGSAYITDLQAVIAKSRQHFGKTIGWVVARVSYDNFRNINSAIIAAQNSVISSTSNVFAGPNTDGIQIPRPDNFHFQNGGLNTVADAWNSSLNDSFFSNCAPYTSSYPTISASCGNNQLNISVQGMSSVQWNNGANSGNVSFGSGNYQATARDATGNVYYTPNINVANDLQNASVGINVDGRLALCQGSSVGLVSSQSNGNSWSNGSGDARINVSSAGTYTLTNRNKYNCTASASVNVTAISSPLPAAPTISTSGVTKFCQGGQVTLTSSALNEYRWSNGERNQSITVKNGGTYSVQVVDGQGCTSAAAQINVQVDIPPAAPTINSSGPATFCQGGQVTLSSNYPNGNVWSSNEQSRDITVSRSGTYNVRFRDGNGCDAISNNIVVTVNPLPEKPSITREGTTTFCEGQTLALTANSTSSSVQYNWSSNERTRRITIGRNGNFSLSVTDPNGCTSPVSDAVSVVVNPLPAPPVISANRTPNICENESVVFTANSQTAYTWSNGQTTQSITANIAGRYSARSVDGNACVSNPSNIISLNVNPLPPKPTIIAQSPTTFCAGDRVVLRSNYTSGLSWNTNESSPQITVFSAGEYRVRFRDGNGCESFQSDPTFVTVNSLPAAPRIVNERPTSFCQNDSTILNIPLSAALFDFRWSTGASGSRIVAKRSGNITATVIEYRTGCTSPASEAVSITANPLPEQPTVTASGPTVFCADQSVTLTSSPATAYEWSNQATTQNVSVNREARYSLRVRNQFGCLSDFSNPVSVRVNALPPAPSVIAEGPITFCDGGQVGLRVESLFETTWNTTEPGRRIVAKQSGNYAARIKDQNGCFSLFSAAVRVDAKPLPNAPIVQKAGIYTLEAVGSMPEANYIWLLNEQPFAGNTSIIKANKTGNYRVQASVKYGNLECFSKPSAALEFTPETANGGLGVYPNPTFNGKITIETLENLQNATVIVYDLRGRPIYHQFVPIIDGRKQFDLSELAPASYYLRVVTNSYQQGKKILVSLP